MFCSNRTAVRDTCLEDVRVKSFHLHPEVHLTVGVWERTVFGREIVEKYETYFVADTLSSDFLRFF